MSGFIRKRGFLVVRSLLVLTVLFAVGAFLATAFRPAKASLTPLSLLGAGRAAPMSFGTGVVTVTNPTGDCLAFTAGNGGGPDNWEVVQGGTYHITVSGVTECPGSTAITLFIQSTPLGNRCLTLTGGDGTFEGDITMPNPGCETMPISYKCGADQPCNNSGAIDASGPNSSSVHFRFANFDGSCNKTGNDVDCTGGGGGNGCLITAPPGGDLGCNPAPSEYACGTATVNPSGDCVPSQVTCTPGTPSNTGGCNWSVTNTYSAFCTNHPELTCTETQTFTWKVDTTPPELHGVPADGTDLGCNPTATGCSAFTVTATDNCDGTVAAHCQSQGITGDGCYWSETLTFSAVDSCNNPVSVDRTIVWKTDSVGPKLHNVPTGGNIGCNPQTLPSCDPNVTADDNCDAGAIHVTCTPGVIEDTANCGKSQTFTYTADADACGNPGESKQVTYTWTESTVTIDCPTNLVPLHAGENCCALLPSAYRATGHGCGAGDVVYKVGDTVIDIDTYCFGVGDTVVNASVTGPCGSANCNFTVTVLGKVCAKKFYDANVNGLDDDGIVIPGWPMVVKDSNGNTVGNSVTGSDGTVCFDLPAGEYTVYEGTGIGTYINTTPTSQAASLTAANCHPNVSFGNVCLGAGGGLTLGFWSNRNGQTVMTNGGLLTSVVNALVCGGTSPALANYTGPQGTFGSYSAFRTWLLNATATNMAYMLSAQLTAMRLNVAAGFVQGGSLVYAPGCGNTGSGNNFISISDLIDAAIAAVCADKYTPAGDPNRATQECLKIALDKANNNLNFVQGQPCGFSLEQTPNLREWMLSHAPKLHDWIFGTD